MGRFAALTSYNVWPIMLEASGRYCLCVVKKVSVILCSDLN